MDNPIAVPRSRRLVRAIFSAVFLCLAWLAVAGCAEGQIYSSETSGNGLEDTVVYENPNGKEHPLDSSQNEVLYTAQPLDVVKWTQEPKIAAGALVAAGVVEQDARLFNPIDGEGFAFEVRYKTHDDPMVVLLPDLGPAAIWQTDLTVAPTELEVYGSSFTLHAYSPLFMDSNNADLEIRVYGYDKSGTPSLLAVRNLAGN